MRPYLRALMLMLYLICASVIVTAQDAADPIADPIEPAPETTEEPRPTITIDAEDGLLLVGEFLGAYGGDGRTVLLLHQMYTTRTSWYPQIETLRASGYHVLVVDLRGNGDTGGRINWNQAQDDTQTWLNWLAEQPGVRADAIFTMGSSIGSSLAINGCADFAGCAGAVAISPGLRYYGVTTTDALENSVPTFIVHADLDPYPRRDVPRMEALEGYNGTTLVYSGRKHGIDLFNEHEDMLPQIVAWMNARP